MEVCRLMKVSMEEMDAFFKELVFQDVNVSTNKNVKSKDIHSGYSYTKKIKNSRGREEKVRAKIHKLESGIYSVSFTSSKGVNHSIYSYVPAEDECEIEMTYTETFDSDLESKKGFIALLYDRVYKKKLLKRLSDIESLIEKERE